MKLQDASSIYLGASTVSKIYEGSSLVYDNQSPAPTPTPVSTVTFTNSASQLVVQNGGTDGTAYNLTKNGVAGTMNTTGWTFTDTNISFYADCVATAGTGTTWNSRIRTTAPTSTSPYRFTFYGSNIGYGSATDAIVISAPTGRSITKMVMHFTAANRLTAAANMRINTTDTLTADSTALTGTWEGSAQELRITYPDASAITQWDTFEITYN